MNICGILLALFLMSAAGAQAPNNNSLQLKIHAPSKRVTSFKKIYVSADLKNIGSETYQGSAFMNYAFAVLLTEDGGSERTCELMVGELRGPFDFQARLVPGQIFTRYMPMANYSCGQISSPDISLRVRFWVNQQIIPLAKPGRAQKEMSPPVYIYSNALQFHIVQNSNKTL